MSPRSTPFRLEQLDFELGQAIDLATVQGGAGSLGVSSKRSLWNKENHTHYDLTETLSHLEGYVEQHHQELRMME